METDETFSNLKVWNNFVGRFAGRASLQVASTDGATTSASRETCRALSGYGHLALCSANESSVSIVGIRPKRTRVVLGLAARFGFCCIAMETCGSLREALGEASRVSLCALSLLRAELNSTFRVSPKLYYNSSETRFTFVRSFAHLPFILIPQVSDEW